MKKINLISVFIFTVCFIFADEINIYEPIKVATFNAGSSQEDLGLRIPGIPGGYNAPMCFVIDKKKQVYVTDSVNFKIKIYDLNFNYIGSINEKGDGAVYKAYRLDIDNEGNIIYYDIDSGIVKINSQGTRIFQVKPEKLPKEVKDLQDYFIVENSLFYFDNDSISSYGLINKSGAIIKGSEAVNILTGIRNKLQNNNNDINFSFIDEKFQQDVFHNSSAMIINNRFLTSDFNKHREYLDEIKNKISHLEDNDFFNKMVEDKRNLVFKELPYISTYLIGFDEDGNTYWKQSGKGMQIIVLSRYGNILDLFDITYFIQTSNSDVAISPEGDIYFMKINYDDKVTEFYRIDRGW